MEALKLIKLGLNRFTAVWEALKEKVSKQPVSPGLIKDAGFTFFNAVNEHVTAYNIPYELIINKDQAPLPYFLISKYTLEEKGVKTVAITNSSDYQQITGTLAVSMKDGFLPMQLIYQEKTMRYHPKVDFPAGFSNSIFKPLVEYRKMYRTNQRGFDSLCY